GAALRGEEVSKTLALRLDVAYEYLVENSESIAVVSGGQGDNEEIPEATAMKRYLVRKGIDADRIIEEDKSTRTVENFQFSKEILDGIFQEEYSVVYVTNGFHIFRSSLLAKQMGLNGSGLSADDVWYLELAHYIREYFSILKYFVIDR
ncbi:MAG: YdcF family protein, partial [Anaerotignaceae bacterium]